VRDILFIDDICRLVEMEIERVNSIAGEVFNVGGGMGQTLSLIEATAILREKFGRDVPITVEDQPRKADQCIYISDIRKAQRLLGWSPRVTIKAGYERIIEWICKNERELRLLYC
jgi:CDP-paratose 2-epimerase